MPLSTSSATAREAVAAAAAHPAVAGAAATAAAVAAADAARRENAIKVQRLSLYQITNSKHQASSS